MKKSISDLERDTEITKQRLADQQRFIERSTVFTEVELEEFQRITQHKKCKENYQQGTRVPKHMWSRCG